MRIITIAAGVGNSVAVESKNKNLEDMRNINFLYMTISGFCLACLVSMYQPFMKIWVGDKLLFSEMIMILFSLYFILQKIGDVEAQYFDAAGLWWHGKWRGIIEAGFNLVLNIALGYYFGVIGIVLATIITIVFINFPLSTYYTFKFYFKQSMFAFVLEQIAITVKIILCSAACYFVVELLPIGITLWQQLVIMILRGLIAIIIYIILFKLLNIKNERFKKSVSWIKLKF